MIVFPSGYCKTKYPGYFWNVNDQKLYSIKSGVLKPLTLRKAFYNRYVDFPIGYNVSNNGVSRFVSLETLKQIRYTGATQVVDVKS